MRRDKYNRIIGRRKSFNRCRTKYKADRRYLLMAGCLTLMAAVISLQRCWWVNRRKYFNKVLDQFSFSRRYRKELARAVDAN